MTNKRLEELRKQHMNDFITIATALSNLVSHNNLHDLDDINRLKQAVRNMNDTYHELSDEVSKHVTSENDD